MEGEESQESKHLLYLPELKTLGKKSKIHLFRNICNKCTQHGRTQTMFLYGLRYMRGHLSHQSTIVLDKKILDVAHS